MRTVFWIAERISHRRFSRVFVYVFLLAKTALEEVRESKAMETAVNWLDALSLEVSASSALTPHWYET